MNMCCYKIRQFILIFLVQNELITKNIKLEPGFALNKVKCSKLAHINVVSSPPSPSSIQRILYGVRNTLILII